MDDKPRANADSSADGGCESGDGRPRACQDRLGALPKKGCLVLAGALVLGSLALPESAGAQPAIRVQGGERRARALPEPLAPGVSPGSHESAPSPDSSDGPKSVSHKRGPAPREPADRLPQDVPLSEPNQSARAGIAEGEPTSRGAKVLPDEQLEQLRAAEEVLFSEQVRGLSPGWSFELPEAADAEQRALGLPLTPAQHLAPQLDPEDIRWLRSLTLPDLPVRLDSRVVTYLKFYRDSHRGRTIAAIWSRKSGRYVSSMKSMLRRAGLPTDLVWLSLIESGHNPTIRSPAGAVGLWQFIPETGRMYGLTVDRWVDERRDPARSTEAAIRFLGDLYQRFGNWELAMASYNMGYAGMSRSIAKYNTNDYWTLSRLEGGIPWETSLYVPKIFALAIVMNNRQEFGLSRIEPDPAVTFDTILVEPATPLSDVARAAGVAQSEIEELNPQLLSTRIPPVAPSEARKRWRVRVPTGSGAQAQAKLAGAKTKVATYLSKFGDTAAAIAAEFGITERALSEANGLEPDEVLEQGTVLMLPERADPDAKPAPPQAVVVSRMLQPAADQRRLFYEVRAGDRLEEIANAFGAQVTDLVRWNALDADAKLRQGMVLQVLVPRERDLSAVRYFDAGEAKLLLAGSPEFHEFHESQKGKHRLEITARPGDTLASIGRRHGMSVGSMERVNRRSRSAKLVPGETLVVYSARASDSASVGPDSEPLPEVEPPRPELLPGAR